MQHTQSSCLSTAPQQGWQTSPPCCRTCCRSPWVSIQGLSHDNGSISCPPCAGEPATFPPEKPALVGCPPAAVQSCCVGGARDAASGGRSPSPTPQSLHPNARTDLHCLHPPLVPLLVVDHRAVLARWLVPRAVVNHILQGGQQQKRCFVVSS